ncbi:hypothetical protein Mag101_00715 [Microbulbifer agarilyticus]|uniref:Cytochrome c domain-containing protein n=1 Tax=Microbulbifer agarilyticus TaxID=260552 RepID=A0A1Q2M0V4_9GAMM|nr:hypothetical protein Mag101_00715 [Microbulbifer agarilyticus]
MIFTDSQGNSYYRYETDLGAVDVNTTYTLEMRLQGGEFPGGQCISEITVRPGEGVTDAVCYTPGTGGGETPAPEAPKPTVGMVVTDGATGQARLIGGEATGKAGFALYTFLNDGDNVSNCSGGCEDNWPKVIVADPADVVGAGGVTGDFGAIPRTYETTNDCGDTVEVTDYHVTYNGEPLYFYAGDTSADDTNGIAFSTWELADASLIPQLPLVKHPAPALKTAINGLVPREMGMAIDIEGRTLTWRPGSNSSLTGGLIAQFSPYGGEGAPRSAKDPNLELWCSNNQIQFHKADLPGTLTGPYSAEIPGACYGQFYYFLRYRIFGTVNNEPEDNWVYTALFEYDENNPDDRIDPRNRPTVTYTSANWQRHGHPHSRDRPEEFVSFDAAPYNNSLTSGLERYTTTFIDGEGEFAIQPNASTAPLRIEAFEWGAGNCQGPQYIINSFPLPANAFDYGQIVSWEATFPTAQNNFPNGTSISSQVYNTMQNTTIGQGFTTATGDPRLNLAGPAGVRMVHSNGCNPVEDEERNARFTQQVTTVQSAEQVDQFIWGHHAFHGLPQVSGGRPNQEGFTDAVAITDVDGNVIKDAGQGSCGDCHFRDGRSDFVVNTAKGPLLAPPTFGIGLLQWIEGAETGLTWDGSVATVREQAEGALLADLGLTPADIGETVFNQIVTYTETLHVPVRDYDTYVDPQVAEGEVAFFEAGCADCHQPTQKTRSDAPDWARDLAIRPYTDMKLWDVGTGGDFRTPALWAIGQNVELLERNGKATLFMHDGRANSLEAAIDAHGNGSVPALTTDEKADIVRFLRSL